MRIFTFVLGLGLLALSGTTTAAREEEATDIIYAWLRYDMDALVWGAGQTYVAAGCVGQTNKETRRCTLNEFINFVTFGKAAEEPGYHELTSTLEITAGSYGNALDALKKMWDPPTDQVYTRYAGGLKTPAGLSRLLGNTLKLTRAEAIAKNVDVSRSLSNIRFVVDTMATFGRANLHLGLVNSIPKMVDIVFDVITKHDMSKGSWSEFDWDKITNKYPQLMDPTSALSRQLRTALTTHFRLPAHARARTRLQHISDVKRLCF